MNQITEAIKHLIIINVLFYLVTYMIPTPGLQPKMMEWMALYYPTSPYFKFWQPITHMFMHGSFYHILFNMYGLWAFGGPLEQIWGKKKFVLFYFSAGIGAAILYTLANFYANDTTSIAVGASGAVYGVLVAYGIYYPNSKLALLFFPFPIAAKYFIPLIIFGDLFFGVTNYSIGNIAHFAHIGGALIGFVIAWYWKSNSFNNKRWN